MIYYLGQTVLCSWGVKKPAVITGFSSTGSVLLSYFMMNGELKENDLTIDSHIKILRQDDKESPSGKRIYYGKFCRFVSPDNGVGIKLPTTEKLKEEFENAKKLCNISDE
jgi:hypothetical protein